MSRYEWVDESTLSFEERLGLAYCRLNSHQWDELLGEKPERYDDPEVGAQISVEIMGRIKNIIGPAKASECWWRFEKIGSHADWLRWYCVDNSLMKFTKPVKNPFKRIPHWPRKQRSPKG